MTIVSGGQTGVDRAALDVAIQLGMDHGGWCPKGRRAEDGTIPEKYILQETPTSDYSERTQWNVRDSEATLVITIGEPTGGTKFTIECCRKLSKPFFIINLERPLELDASRSWMMKFKNSTINIAGPRESFKPGFVYSKAFEILQTLIQSLPSHNS